MKRHHQGILQGLNTVVLMGGPGSERDVSLRSGAAVLRALAECGARVSALDVEGTSLELPGDTDLAFNVIHGTFGEDGDLQTLLERMGIPFTGEGSTGSRIAFDKILTKERFDAAGIPTARWRTVRRGDSMDFQLPCVIKAPRQGSSLGVHIVREPGEIAPALDDCFRFGDRVLVEEFFKGRELTVGILGDEALPVVEIRPLSGFYDYKNKYTSGASEYHVPAPLDPALAARVASTALAAHRALGLEVYSRVDILLADDGSMNVMEINTIPGMTELSLLPKAAACVGLGFGALCEEIAGISMERFRKQ
jgi:D-alanine-D-alanine ligase